VPSTKSGPLAAVVSELRSTTGWCALAGVCTANREVQITRAVSDFLIAKKYKMSLLSAV